MTTTNPQAKSEAARCADWLEHVAAGGDVVDIEPLAKASAAELRRAIELARETVTVVGALAAALGDMPIEPTDTLIPRMIDRAWALAGQQAQSAHAIPRGLKVTDEMHQAACKVLLRANGVKDLPQRMLDAMLAAAPAAPQPAEPLARYCPGCGSVGPVEAQYRDCCPDGSEARMIPQDLAQKCHDHFQLALGAALAAQQAAPAAQEPIDLREAAAYALQVLNHGSGKQARLRAITRLKKALGLEGSAA